MSRCRGEWDIPRETVRLLPDGSAAASHVDDPTLGFPLPHECRSDAGAARAPADASIASDATVIGTGGETLASMGTEDPGAPLLSGRGERCRSRRPTRALIPGAAPVGLLPGGGPWDDLRGHRAAGGRVIRLYIIPGSNPSVAAELMLKRKGIDYRRRDLIPAVHIAIVRALGFPGRTVPALTSDGRKVQGSRAIARFLDELKPEPSLFPAEPARRAAVEEAERWGDEELQSVPRRLAWFALRRWRDRSMLKEFLGDYRLGVPTSVAAAMMAPIAWVEQRINKASAAAVRADLERLPALLDHVDELLARGVIGGEEPNAADYQIAPSLCLLLAFEQLWPLIEARPAGAFATRVAPVLPGHIPPVLPADWVPSC